MPTGIRTRSRALSLLGLPFCLLLLACGSADASADKKELRGDLAREPNPDPTALAAGNSRFALDLYDELRGDDGNLLFSPFSISAALAMTAAGADGATAEEMGRVLHLPSENREVHQGFADLLGRLDSDGSQGGAVLAIANRLWGQRGYSFRDDYLALCADRYGAGLGELDFVAAPEPARRTINGWVAERTAGHIPDLLPDGSITPLTRLVLTNAVYFKGTWASRFDQEETRQEPFHRAAGDPVTAPFMIQNGRFPYAEMEGVQILELPYAGGELAMVVVLPAERHGLPELETRLSGELLESWIGALSEREVEVSLPRFETTTRFALAERLQEMGIVAAFREPSLAGGADFSRMTGTRELFLDDVHHQAWIRVDEEGTEAAAATGVTVTLTSVPIPAVFRADHPFIFLIRQRGSATILFLGRMLDPSA